MVYEREQGIFYTSDVTKICGVKRPRLQQWIDRGLVHPGVERATSPGQQNKWAWQDLADICLVRNLIDFGLSRKAITHFANSPHSGYIAVVEGSEASIYQGGSPTELVKEAKSYEAMDHCWRLFLGYEQEHFEVVYLVSNSHRGLEIAMRHILKLVSLAMTETDTKPTRSIRPQLNLITYLNDIFDEVDQKIEELGFK